MCLALRYFLSDVQILNRANIILSCLYNTFTQFLRDVLLVGRAKVFSVAAFHNQVTNGRSSELCSAMFLKKNHWFIKKNYGLTSMEDVEVSVRITLSTTLLELKVVLVSI